MQLFKRHAFDDYRLSAIRPESHNIQMGRIYCISVGILHIVQIHNDLARFVEIIHGRLAPVVVLIEEPERHGAVIIIAQSDGYAAESRQIQSFSILPSSKSVLTGNERMCLLIE